MAKDLKSLRSDIGTMNSSIGEMKGSINEMNGKMDGLTTEMKSMLTELKDMKSDMKTMTGQITSLTKEIVVMSKQMGTMSEQMSGMFTTMKELNVSMKDMGGDLKEMLGQMNGLTSAILGMAAKMDTLVGAMGNMTTTVNAMGSSMGRLETQMKSVTVAVESMLIAIQPLNQTIIEMNATVQNVGLMMAGIDEKMDEIAAITGPLASALTVVNKTMGDLQVVVKGTIEAMGNVNETVKQMIDKMEIVDRLEGSIASMKSDLGLMTNLLQVLGRAGSQGITAILRNTFFNELQSSDDPEGKLAAATKYLLAYTFHTWNHSAGDSKESRLGLMALMPAEFFPTLGKLIDKGNLSLHPVAALAKPLSSAKAKDKYLSLQLIAAMLDYTNKIQADGLVGSNEPIVSHYTMMIDALKSSKEVKSGRITNSSLPHYQQEILKFEGTAIYLLQLRHNILVGLAFQMISNKKNGSPEAKSKSFFGLFKSKSARGTSLSNKTESKNAEELETIADFLNQASATREALVQAGVKLDIHSFTNRLINDFEIDASRRQDAEAEVVALEAALRRLEASKRLAPVNEVQD